MVNGSIILNTDMSGGPIVTGIVISILTNQEGIGFGQNMIAGCGSPIMNGVGLHSIMVVGSMIHTTDGFGSLIMNGRRHG